MSASHTSPRTTPPFRADHVGSLLRPPELLAARAAFADGRLPADDLRAVEDQSIRDAVALQQEVGLHAVTDGEFRRGSWHMDFLYQLKGVSRVTDQLTSVFRNKTETFRFTPDKAVVTDKLGIDETIFGDAFTFLRDTVTDGTPKLTIPSPSMLHYRGGRAAIGLDVYPAMDEFWQDLGDAYAEQLRRLGELGCTYVQLDDTTFGYLADPSQRTGIASRGEDAERLHLTYIDTINRALAGRPEGMTVTVHMCRGNFRSSWVAEGGYEFVAEPLLGGLDVDGFFMEWDDERSGDFSPLRFVADGKLVVLGLVTSKRPELETKDELKRRIEEASRFLDIDRLCLSPQCGFSSTVDGNALSIEQERAKLELVVQTAQEVWGSAR